MEQFDTYWPLTDAVWTKIGGKTQQQNGTVEVQHYECRLRKSKKTGTNVAKKEGRVVKARITTSRVKDLCQVRMKMTRTLTEPITITLERKDDPFACFQAIALIRLRTAIGGMRPILGETLSTHPSKFSRPRCLKFFNMQRDSIHTHDLEETFRLCAVKRVVQAEADKDYTAAQIFHALKGGGKVDGSVALEAIGGASLKR
jgi:hypothetical protein